VGVGYLLVQRPVRPRAQLKGSPSALLVSVAVSWLVVHTLFILRYALLHYAGDDGGVNFNQAARPRYSDFAFGSYDDAACGQRSRVESMTGSGHSRFRRATSSWRCASASLPVLGRATVGRFVSKHPPGLHDLTWCGGRLTV